MNPGRLRACATVLLLLAPVAHAAADRPLRKAGPLEDFMHNLSGIYVAMYNAVEAEDSEPARALAEKFGDQKSALAGLRSGLNADTMDILENAMSEFQMAGIRISEAISRSDIKEAKFMLHTIRGRCVSCHMSRRGPAVDEIFMEKGAGAVTGTVRIFLPDGEKWPDASDVVVFVDGFSETPDSTPAGRPPALSQKNKTFYPRVLPVLAGTTVDFPNDDDFFHNVFSLSKAKPFDLGLYRQGESKSVTFDRQGLVKVYCNIHPQMVSNILVLNNSHFWTTSSNGNFALLDLPPGTHTIRAWFEYGDPVTRQVWVRADGVSRVDLELVKVRPRGEHLNKFGQTYEGKY